MKLGNAAFGLAAVGAGFLVARALKAWRSGSTEYVGVEGYVEPPEPSRLVGHPLSGRSAREAAEVLGNSPIRRM